MQNILSFRKIYLKDFKWVKINSKFIIEVLQSLDMFN